MFKNYTSLGLMSGTSGDGVDASIINSNGVDEIDIIKEKYFEYDSIKVYGGVKITLYLFLFLSLE